MGKTGTTAGTLVTEYRMSMHMGICHGPVDALLAIKVGDKVAWEGDIQSGIVTVDSRELFGGPTKEGGVAGHVYVMDGNPNQMLLPEVAEKLGGTPTTVPGFRGILSVFFKGMYGDRPGFYWGNNTPYIKNTSFKLRRVPRGFYEEKAMIGQDCNPIAIIAECLTNKAWGMGGSASQYDEANFRHAADTLYNEGMGLSLIWTGQSKIEDFTQEILDHIEATFFTNPRTGLYNIKLIRPDYDPADLFHLNDENAVIDKFHRKAWGETINEINASWTNPENEQEENVTVHDLGNIAAQGGIVSAGRNYYAVRNSALALRLAQRDLTSAAFPVASCEARVNRSAWKETPGNPVRVSSSQHGLSELVMRVGSINYGRKGSPEITVTLVEDVFALPSESYVSSPDTEWENPSIAPEALAFHRFMDVPYYVAARAFGDEGAENIIYPQTYVGVLGAQDSPGTFSINVLANGVDAAGDPDFRSIGEFNAAGRGSLSSSMPRAATSLMPAFTTFHGGVGLEPNVMVLIGTMEDFELALVTGVSGSLATLRRGILDTVPKSWPTGTVVWIFRPNSNIYDPTARAAGQTITYKFLPRTSLGLYPASLAAEVPYYTGDRLHRPLRPANVKLNGTLFGPEALDYESEGLELTWSTRNRLVETAVISAWTDASVTPEAGQTSRVTIYNEDDSIIEQVSGITGTSYTASFDADLINGDSIRYAVDSVRGSLPSLQRAEATVITATPATGFDVYALLGQSNMVGAFNAPPNLTYDSPHPRIYQRKQDGTIVVATEYLDHPGSGFVGPGLNFGKVMADDLTGSRNILLVPCAVGGSPLVVGSADWGVGGSLYNHAMATITAAMGSMPGNRMRGFLWGQGEAEAGAGTPGATYKAALSATLTGLRNGIPGARYAPVVIGGMVPEWVAVTAGAPAIQAALASMVTELPRVGYQPGLAGFQDPNPAEAVHYTDMGNRLRGIDFANLMKTL